MDKTFLAALIASLVILSAPAFADIAIPTETTVYFEKNGQPWNQPVDYSVKCYGYRWTPGPDMDKEPGTYTPEEVYSYSASCPAYGCKTNEGYYLNYRHIDSCDLGGTTNGQSFKISNFADTPLPDCTEGMERTCTARFQLPDSVTGGTGPSQPSTNPPAPRGGDNSMIILIAAIVIVAALAGLFLMKSGKCPCKCCGKPGKVK